MKQKIFPLEKMQKILNKERTKGKKIVLCHGVFDLLHIVGNITFVIWFSTPLSEMMLKHNQTFKLGVAENGPIRI